jgi:ribosomal protein S12 methylthiotransferase accessory factor
MTAAVPADCLHEQLAAELGIEVCEQAQDQWPFALSRYGYVARIAKGSNLTKGLGCGSTPIEGRRRAIMECVERFAPYCCDVPPTRVASGESLGLDAISPNAFGLYSDSQYNYPRFPFVRYVERKPLEWLAVKEMTVERECFVPIEFAYPMATIGRQRLVGETSNGAAAHRSRDAARLSALCELIERDSVLMFWHRQPPTRVLPAASMSAAALHDLDLIRAMGYVVVVCDLTYDLAIPCVLALAFRGDRVVYGSGCHPSVVQSADHAVRELATLLRWQIQYLDAPRRLAALDEVRKPKDHHALYDGGPLHGLLRQALDHALSLPTPHRDWSGLSTVSDEESLGQVVDQLKSQGYDVYECDLTPPIARRFGVWVVRAFVPGLIPMYFGWDQIRFGCRRIWSREAPGRLCNLLPHFMS